MNQKIDKSYQTEMKELIENTHQYWESSNYKSQKSSKIDDSFKTEYNYLKDLDILKKKITNEINFNKSLHNAKENYMRES